MDHEYYQLGGFRPHINWFDYQYDDKRLAQIIAGDNSPLRTRGQEAVELVLGIKLVGTSHLLITQEQCETLVRTLRKQYPRAPPLRTADFESLSPIYFNNATELAEKLGLLKPKSAKGRTPKDSSQANRQYISGDDGIPRGEFEHGRSFYLILHDKIDIGKYCLSPPSWKQSIQVYSFVFTQRSPDTRPPDERRKNPTMLDCGLAQSALPDLHCRAESAIHLYSTTDRHLNAGSSKMPFVHGTTSELDSAQLRVYLRNFFTERTGANSGPMILLVHDEDISKSLLNNCGVDTSSWESGIKGLLGFGGLKGYIGSHDRRDSHRSSGLSSPSRERYRCDADYKARRDRPRPRSRSPHPNDPRSQPASRMSAPLSYSDSTSIPDLSKRPYAPVYVVDIKKQFNKLMQTRTFSESPMRISQYLGMSDRDVRGWCAGNGAVTLIEIWKSMVSGPPIDDQKSFREQGIDQNLRDTNDPTGPAEYDSDQDPNDIVQMAEPTQDSDSDYGESTDSDD